MGEQAYAVTIVGAGPTGLSLAIELGSRGIRCLLVERQDRVGYAPRAKTTNVRTRTHLRRWGIAHKLAAASPLGIHYPSNVLFVTCLSGALLARIENASNCDPGRSPLYPEHGQWVPQYKLEQVLRDHVGTFDSVDLSFSTEMVSVTQDSHEVTVQLRDRVTQSDRFVTCHYLVGADGARSAVRAAIGATMNGYYGLSRNYNIVFRAPGLAQAHLHGAATMYWQTNPAAPSLIGPMDRDDVWFFMPTRLPEGFNLTDAEAVDLIRTATGIDLPYEILSRDEWVASSLIADHYHRGHILLAGDACHLHPPFGGYGMNMGVSDAVDLGWKIAATLAGWGGPELLDSYESERRPIHEAVMAEATLNHASLSNDFSDPALDGHGETADLLRETVRNRILKAKEREFHTLGTVLGGCYRGSPIVAAEIADVPARNQVGSVYRPSSAPGCLAPHLWMPDGRSLYDCFGRDFTLLMRPTADSAAVAEARRRADVMGVGLQVRALDVDEAGPLYPAPLTLVRPDQHVAWRGSIWPQGLWEKVTGWSQS